jgi:hypothetical protein
MTVPAEAPFPLSAPGDVAVAAGDVRAESASALDCEQAPNAELAVSTAAHAAMVVKPTERERAGMTP